MTTQPRLFIGLDGLNICYDEDGEFNPNRLITVSNYFHSRFSIAEIHVWLPLFIKKKIGDIAKKMDENCTMHWMFIPPEEGDRDDKDMLAWTMMKGGRFVSNDQMRNHIENGLVDPDWVNVRRIPFTFDQDGNFHPNLSAWKYGGGENASH